MGGDPTRKGILGGGLHWAVLELQITNLLNRLSTAMLFLNHIKGESMHTIALFLKHLSHSVLASQALVFWYSSPQPFWHQGSVLWKKIFPRIWGGGWFQDDSSTLHLLCSLLLTHQFHLTSSGIRSWRLEIPVLVDFQGFISQFLQVWKQDIINTLREQDLTSDSCVQILVLLFQTVWTREFFFSLWNDNFILFYYLFIYFY